MAARLGGGESAAFIRIEMILLLMGVAGAGKTSVGRVLADRLGYEFLDADYLHSANNVEKMRTGVPLTDADREPWLAAVASALDAFAAAGISAVVACSALKQKYREQLMKRGVILVYLKITPGLAAVRAIERHHDFMPATLVASQFEDLEEPEGVLTLDASLPVERVVDEIAGRIAGTE